ncbi:MAG TPA: hypothetical protein VE172_20875 [Stackebrandtia sp.]|jgi:hypothetical protein|uniref:hypothetical protein n=1 Tax=Stackebrandtia sp. TaxID=2023065 RepID=UPI002D31B8BA|nr:hypothetical protein [Stackebrandtia sp.]HZE41262.1 hypothetical protein [Stackebrandtia sp.]
MSTFTTALRDLSCTATSPDGTVRARLSNGRPVEVNLSPNAWRRHSEASLATQAAAAVQDVVIGYQESVDERRFDGQDPLRLARDGNDFAKRQLAFQRAVAELAVVGASTVGYVEVEWRGMADIRIRIEPGTIARLNRSQLRGELQSAIAAAGRSRNRRILRLNERYYGPLPFPPNKGGEHV